MTDTLDLTNTPGLICAGASCKTRTKTQHWHGNNDLTSMLLPVDGLTHHPDNPRRGNPRLIAESLATHGQYRPLLARGNIKARHVLVGNHTLMGARLLGWTHIAVTLRDCTADQARRILLIDNQTSDLSTNDRRQLEVLLGELAATPLKLAGTGWSDLDLDSLARQHAAYERGSTDQLAEWDGLAGDWESENLQGIKVTIHVLTETDLDDLLEVLGRPRGGRNMRARSFWWPERPEAVTGLEDHTQAYVSL